MYNPQTHYLIFGAILYQMLLEHSRKIYSVATAFATNTFSLTPIQSIQNKLQIFCEKYRFKNKYVRPLLASTHHHIADNSTI